MTAKEQLSRSVKAENLLLEQALLDAEAAILDMTHRTRITEPLISLQVALAAVYVGRMQAAGEVSRTEGEVSVTYAYSKEIPEDLLRRIVAKRKLRQAGIANAAKEY
ncbi:MAG: hypothetical protein ACI4R5_03230 [Acetatifactor sp.]